MNSYGKLKKRYKNLHHLYYIQRMLMWDEAVLMPEGAGEYRAESIAMLNQLMQKSITSKKVLGLIETAKNENLSSPWDAANLAWMEKKYISYHCIPSKLNANSTKLKLAAFQAWRKYREQNNWLDFMPYLKQSFKVLLEIAERKSQVFCLSPYEAMMDSFSPGLTQGKVDEIFSILKKRIPALRKQIIEKQKNDSVMELNGQFPSDKQAELARFLLKAMGFDFNHGRLDISHHPFCDGIPKDVRITTRYDENNFLRSMYSVIHECGHALYEQGMPKDWMSQPVGQTQCKALHESQSLLFEYEVCHSRAFLESIEKQVHQAFDSNLSLSIDNLYRLIAGVKTNLIRIDADEVSYPLHVIFRYEIEKKLFQGEITIEDLPKVWDEMMLQYFDVSTEGNYQEGVMQDMHWSWGYFGYFPSYTFGQLMASQLYSVFCKENVNFESQLKTGDFSALHKWLQKKVYSYASSVSTEELILKITGEALNPEYFINKVQSRYL